MRLFVILAIGATLGLGFPVVGFGNPPVMIVGNTFSEHFIDGFDHPGAVTSSQNLAFESGLARLLEDGSLVYNFTYDPAQSNWGVLDTTFGSFWVSFLDELQNDASLAILLETETSIYGPATQIQLQVVEGDLLVSVDRQGFDNISVTVPRVAGVTRFGFPPTVDSWSPMIITGDGQVNVLSDLYLVGPLQPLRLSISGRAFAIDAITLDTYTAVGNAQSTWGALKSAY